MLVDDFKKALTKDNKLIKVKHTRVRLLMGEKKGQPLVDRTKTLQDYCKADLENNVQLYYKDMGPQVDWYTVFYVEYAGPIVITLALLLFRKHIYGSNPGLSYR